MADALVNCPYCGGPVYVDRGDGGVGTINCVKGSSCLGSGLLVGFKLVDEKTACAAWNTRATPPASVVEAMEKALRTISELNLTAEDENGHKWANSELIDQEITFSLAALTAWRDAQ